MKPDIIIVHPKDLYYPLWVKRMQRDRLLFNRIIVVMTQKARDVDYTNWLNSHLDITLAEDYKDDGRDWRNAAVNCALRYVLSDRVLFLEQDFLVKDGFFAELIDKSKDAFTVGMYEGRLHPACIISKTEIIKKTTKDFSVDTDVGDHFSKFTKEITGFGNWYRLNELIPEGYYHMAGLSQNFRLDSNWYHPPEFYTYLKLSLLDVNQPPDWIEFCTELLNKMPVMEEDLKIKEYFMEAYEN